MPATPLEDARRLDGRSVRHGDIEIQRGRRIDDAANRRRSGRHAGQTCEASGGRAFQERPTARRRCSRGRKRCASVVPGERVVGRSRGTQFGREAFDLLRPRRALGCMILFVMLPHLARRRRTPAAGGRGLGATLLTRLRLAWLFFASACGAPAVSRRAPGPKHDREEGAPRVEPQRHGLLRAAARDGHDHVKLLRAAVPAVDEAACAFAVNYPFDPPRRRRLAWALITTAAARMPTVSRSGARPVPRDPLPKRRYNHARRRPGT